jgi:hypothetical protein
MVAPPRAPLRADRLRAVNEPKKAAVELDHNGQPVAIRRSRNNGGGQKTTAAVKDNGGGQETNTAVVEAVLESWRIEDEWWRHPISRRYFEVLLASGGRVVLFEDLVSGEWFVQTA